MAITKKLHKRSGVEHYYIRFTLADGRRKVEKAGTTLQQAQRLQKKRLGEVVAGTYQDPRRKKEPTGPTFREYSKRFMQDYGNLRRSSYYADRINILNKHFGDRLLQGVTSVHLDRFVVARAQKVGPSTVRKDLTVLGTMFKRAVRWGLLEHNPAIELDKPKEPQYDARSLSYDEYRQLRETAPPWLRPMMRLFVVTGLGRSDLVNLTWDHVDWENNLLHVTRGKTGVPYQIPIGEVARQVLQGQVRHVRQAHVFLDAAGNPFTSKARKTRITRAIKGLMGQAGIESSRPVHTLRHTAGSWAGRVGISGTIINRFLGHSNRRTITDRYIHLNPEHFIDIVRALDEAEQGRATQSATQPQAAGNGPEAKAAKP